MNSCSRRDLPIPAGPETSTALAWRSSAESVSRPGQETTILARGRERRGPAEQAALDLQGLALGEQVHARVVAASSKRAPKQRRDAFLDAHAAGPGGSQKLGGFFDHAAHGRSARQPSDPKRHHDGGVGQMLVNEERAASGQHGLIRGHGALGQGHDHFSPGRRKVLAVKRRASRASSSASVGG
jgi:hypothetical protein